MKPLIFFFTTGLFFLSHILVISGNSALQEIEPDLHDKLISRQTGDDQLIIHYWDKGGDFWILIYYDGYSEIRNLGEVLKLFDLFEGFRSAIINRVDKAYERYGFAIFRLIFGSLEKYKNAIKVVIIPDPLMPSIPFELLLTRNITRQLSYADYPYLFRELEIRYQVSLQAYLNEFVYPPKDSVVRLLAIAPGFLSGDTLKTGFKSPTFQAPLPGSLDELAFLSENYEAKTLIGPLATRELFEQIAKNHSAFHFSTHSDFDGLEQGLYFSFYNPSGIGDAYMTFEDFINLDLKASFIVLSACGQGLSYPAQKKGTNPVGELIEAGFDNIVFSFWEAPDVSTPLLMQYFYHYLSLGYQFSSALSHARNKYLDNCERFLSHPFFWGGFSVAGSGNKVSIVKRKSKAASGSFLYICFVIFAMLLILYFFKKRKEAVL
ncbi:MAG: CHAT domain-containing protein [Bacteroidota bacterium]